mgnify:CR=1 FL=1
MSFRTVGRIATANQIPYSASKFALECAGEALALEVRRFGVRVVNIEPGVILETVRTGASGIGRGERILRI